MKPGTTAARRCAQCSVRTRTTRAWYLYGKRRTTPRVIERIKCSSKNYYGVSSLMVMPPDGRSHRRGACSVYTRDPRDEVETSRVLRRWCMVVGWFACWFGTVLGLLAKTPNLVKTSDGALFIGSGPDGSRNAGGRGDRRGACGVASRLTAGSQGAVSSTRTDVRGDSGMR